jgi:methionyl-tRNA formyltransferase
VSRVRVVFLGTPDFAVTPLESMAKDDHFEIVQVISQPDKPRDRMKLTPSSVKQKALDLGLPVTTTQSVNTPEFLEFIKSLKADVAVVIAFGQIVSQDFLNSFPFGAVNVHASLLPKWRGAAPIQRSIEAGEAETGVSLQIMVKQLDAGPVLGIRKLHVSHEEGASAVYEKLRRLSCELLHVELMDYVRGHLVGVKQDESQVTIAKKIKKEEGEINWEQPARVIQNKLRAFEMWPGVWTYLDGKALKILKVKVVEKKGPPGRILDVTKSSFIVGCGEDSLEVMEVQPESRSKLCVDVFLRGYPLKVGQELKK